MYGAGGRFSACSTHGKIAVASPPPRTQQPRLEPRQWTVAVSSRS